MPSSSSSSRTKSSATAATVTRIKNFLPVRLKLADETDATFFYVKEHAERETDGSRPTTTTTTTTTLFVANCPCVAPPYSAISTKRLLQAIFGRYGDVTRVTVINPRQSSSTSTVDTETTDEWLSAWTNAFHPPSYNVTATSHDIAAEASSTTTSTASHENGKFAHVVFATSKDLKQTMRTLTDLMADPGDDEESTAELPTIELSTLELQTLMDDEEENDDHGPKKSGIEAVAARYRASCQPFTASRQTLLDECNRVMQEYEDATDAAHHQRLHNASVPDDDGFITVSYGNAEVAPTATMDATMTGTKHLLEGTTTTAGRMGGRSSKRTRRHAKKNMGGADPLPDFYRFQTREQRQTAVHELKRRFEEDVRRVKQMQSKST